MAQDRPERLACRPQHAPDRHTHPTRSAFSRLASLQVIEFISLPRMSHASLDAQPSPVLSPVAPARRLPSLSTIDGRSPLGHIGPDAAGGANLQVDRAFEPRPCPEPSAYRRAPLSDARLPGRSSASEAVGEIALWRCRGLARFAPARILPGPCTPTACIAHLLSCSPCLGSAWGQCSMLTLLLHAHLPLVTVHLWRVVLWLEYFWRVRYAAISLLVPVGELPPLQSTSKRI
jgi:hypothetical protein